MTIKTIIFSHLNDAKIELQMTTNDPGSTAEMIYQGELRIEFVKFLLSKFNPNTEITDEGIDSEFKSFLASRK